MRTDARTVGSTGSLRLSAPIRYLAVVVTLVILSCLPVRPVTVVPQKADAARLAAPTCAALELHLAPGLNPPEPRNGFLPAPDAPHTPFTVAVPVYPGATPLRRFVGSPFSEIVASPYLQTASAEYHTTASSDTVSDWYARTLPSCGWRSDGSWGGNAGAFPSGITFHRGRHDPNGVQLEVGFSDRPNGSTDLALAVQGVRYPAPPARARIHGPFVALHITLARPGKSNIHTVVTDRSAIAHVVRAIDSITSAYTVPTVCYLGLRQEGPVWLTFVRSDGTQIHAFEGGPGSCGGGLAVNGVRWLLDSGAVWSLIQSLGMRHG